MVESERKEDEIKALIDDYTLKLCRVKNPWNNILISLHDRYVLCPTMNALFDINI